MNDLSNIPRWSYIDDFIRRSFSSSSSSSSFIFEHHLCCSFPVLFYFHLVSIFSSYHSLSKEEY